MQLQDGIREWELPDTNGSPGLQDTQVWGWAVDGELNQEEFPLHDDDQLIHKLAYKGGDIASIIPTTPDINVRNSGGLTPLHLAVWANRSEIVGALLSAGADPGLECMYEPCYMRTGAVAEVAAFYGSPDAITALIGYGVHMPAATLLIAASLDRHECVRILLQSGRGFSDMTRTQAVRKALERGAMCWHVNTIRCLLTRVAGFPDLSCKEDRQALGNALVNTVNDFDCDDQCRMGSIDAHIEQRYKDKTRYIPAERQIGVMKQLIAAGADINHKHSFENRTVLDYVVMPWGYISRPIMRLLLSDSTDVALPRSKSLLFSAVVGDPDDDPSLLREFFAAGANAMDTDWKGSTPLHRAAHRSFAEILIEEGAGVCIENDDGETPLHSACISLHFGVVELLISRGADVNARTADKKWTPLLLAVSEKAVTHFGDSGARKAIVEVLVKNGADLRATSGNGFTALHEASALGCAKIVTYLISEGAEVDAKGSGCQTSLHLACREYNIMNHAADYLAIVKTLLNHGADLNAKTETGLLPLHYAFDPKFPPLRDLRLVNYLLEKGADKGAKSNVGFSIYNTQGMKDLEWDDTGMLRLKPQPVVEYPGRGRSKGRGMVRGR